MITILYSTKYYTIDRQFLFRVNSKQLINFFLLICLHFGFLFYWYNIIWIAKKLSATLIYFSCRTSDNNYCSELLYSSNFCRKCSSKLLLFTENSILLYSVVSSIQIFDFNQSIRLFSVILLNNKARSAIFVAEALFFYCITDIIDYWQLKCSIRTC